MRITYKFSSLLIILVCSLMTQDLFSAETDSEISKKDTEKTLGYFGGSEYWFTVLPGYRNTDTKEGIVRIYAIPNTKAEIFVEIPGRNFKVSKQANAFEAAIIEIPESIACPWIKTNSQNTPPDSIYKGCGIHVYANTVFVVFVASYTERISESFLALPTSNLGKEHFVTSYTAGNSGGMIMPSMTACVTPYDNVVVKFTPGGNTHTKTINGETPGQTVTDVMQRGDVWLVSAEADSSDLAGSKWVSSKPVAVVSGNYGGLIPLGSTSINPLMEMEIPSFTWGKDYPVPVIPGRKNPPVIRIFAKEKNTIIYRDGEEIGNLSTAGGLINEGWMEIRLNPAGNVPASAVISGDKPIGVAMYNPGNEGDTLTSQVSEPFSCSIISTNGYSKNSTVCVFNIDESATNHYFNLIYRATDSNSINKIEISRPQNGANVWEKLSDLYPGAGYKLPVTIEGFGYYAKNIEVKDTGVYRISAKEPFTVYSYGSTITGEGRPYAHPAAIGLFDAEKPDTMPPVPYYTVCCCCGKTHDAAVRDMPEDSEIRSNMASIIIDTENSYNFVFKHEDFIPGQQQEVKWELNVLDDKEDSKARITFMDRRGNDTTIEIFCQGYKLTAEPAFVDFGNPDIGNESVRTIKLNNESATSAVEIRSLRLKSNNGIFSADLPAMPIKLNPKDSIDINIKFKTDKKGVFNDTLIISDSCHSDRLIALNGAVITVLIQAGDINFGKLLVGQKFTKSVEVYNSGVDDLKITGYKGNNLSCYKHNLGNVSNNNPIIIQPWGEPYRFNITFLPTNIGSFRDSIVFSSNSEPSGDSVVVIEGAAVSTGTSDVIEQTGEVTASPNPAGDFLNLSVYSETGSAAEISVYSVQGFPVLPVIIKQLDKGSNYISLNISELTAGSYYILINHGNSFNRAKFTKVE